MIIHGIEYDQRRIERVAVKPAALFVKTCATSTDPETRVSSPCRRTHRESGSAKEKERDTKGVREPDGGTSALLRPSAQIAG